MFTAKLCKGVSKGYSTVINDMSGLCKQAKANYQIGARLAGIQGKSHTMPTALVSTVKKTKIRKEDLPAVMAIAGTIIPLPLTNVLGYLIGKSVTTSVWKNIFKQIK